MVPHTASTPDWVTTLAGLALSPGAGAVGGLVTTDDGVVVHAGWDEPDYRWYDLVGLRAGGTTSGNDLLIERECTAVSLAAAAVSAAQWRECRHLVHGGFDDAGRSMSAALVARGARTLFTPYARFDRSVTIDG
jgi:heme A synthase